MPVTYFVVRWPDGERERCYSPSSIVREVFETRVYRLDEFVELSRKGLGIASERVRQKFGYACSSAMDQLRLIEARAAAFDETSAVEVIGFAAEGER